MVLLVRWLRYVGLVSVQSNGGGGLGFNGRAGAARLRHSQRLETLNMAKRRKPVVKGSPLNESLSRQRRAILKTMKLLTRQVGSHFQTLADAAVLADARFSRRKTPPVGVASPAKPPDWREALATVKAAAKGE